VIQFLRFEGALWWATLNIKTFPDRLHRRIRKRAGRNDRSIGQEIVHMLDRAVADDERVSLLKLEGLGKAKCTVFLTNDRWLSALPGLAVFQLDAFI
jgi:plasmid stability protein